MLPYGVTLTVPLKSTVEEARLISGGLADAVTAVVARTTGMLTSSEAASYRAVESTEKS